MLAEDHVRQLFQRSNVDAGYVDFNVKVLDAVLSGTGWLSSDVLAVSLSQQPQRLVVVSRAGVALGAAKGVFKLRVDVERFRYITIASFVQEEHERDGSVLEAFGFDSTQLFRITWPETDDGDSKVERDRVLNTALEVWESETAGGAGGSGVRGGA